MLTEVITYYAKLRHEQSVTTSTIFSLAFDPTGSHLAVGTTTGELTVHSLSTAAASPIEHASATECAVSEYHLPSEYGAINALLSISTSLFIATDHGLSLVDWHLIASAGTDFRLCPVYSGSQVNALARLSDSDNVVAATADGSLVRIDNAADPKVTVLPGTLPPSAYPHCLASSPTDRHCVFLGCHDGIVRQVDLRRSKGSVVREISQSALKSPRSPPPVRPTEKSYVTCMAVNPDGTYAMIARSNQMLSSLHIASGAIVSSTRLPFVPQAISFSKGSFYIGGSDRRSDPTSSFPHSLVCFDVLMTCTAVSPVSSTAVYAVTTHPRSGMIAAAGFTPATAPSGTKRLVDVYVDPPVRSFSISV